MLSSAALSEAELRSIREGVLLNFREDGRTLLQQRPVHIYIEHMHQEISNQASESNPISDKHYNKEDNIHSNFLFVHKANTGSEAHSIITEESYNGSKLRLESDGTVILVRAVPTVIEVSTFNSNNSANNTNEKSKESNDERFIRSVQSNINNNNFTEVNEDRNSELEKDKKENHSDGMVKDNEEEEEEEGNGELYIHIDAVHQVVDYYSHLLGGKASRYRRSYLALLAHLIHATFGANGVNCSVSNAGQLSQQQQLLAGIAAAERVYENEDEEMNQNTEIDEEEEEEEEEEVNEDELGNTHFHRQTATSRDGTVEESITGKHKQSKKYHYHNNITMLRSCLPCQTGFPSNELYIGSGYAFRIDVHLHVLQGLGGNITSLLSLAIHVALKTLQLPHVTLQTSAAGVTVEVDQSRMYTRPINWNELPLLISLPIAPSHHYLMDPSMHEEMALPRQCVIAANARGQVCAMQFIQLPSRQKESTVPQYEEENGNRTETHSSNSNTTLLESSSAIKTDQADIEHTLKQNNNTMSKQSKETEFNDYEFNLSDCAALMHDGIQICQTMITDCDKVLNMEWDKYDKVND